MIGTVNAITMLNLSDNFLKQAWFNTVVNWIDKSGPGGSEPTTSGSFVKPTSAYLSEG